MNTAHSIIKGLENISADFAVSSWERIETGRAPWIQLPRNPLLLSSSFYRALKEVSPASIVYIPASSTTDLSAIRCVVLKTLSGRLPLFVLSTQPRRNPVTLRFVSNLRMIDLVLTQSKRRSDLLNNLGIAADWLPPGVDSNHFVPVDSKRKRILRDKYDIRVDSQVVLHVGHLNGFRNLRKLTSLAKVGYSVILVASTRTRADRQLKDELSESGIRIFSEYIQDIREVYQLSDCYYFPVTSEIGSIETPLSVLEAMACNLPVLTTAFGGLPGMFEAGNGLVFVHERTKEVEEIAVLMQMESVGTREKVLPYSWEAVAHMLVDRANGSNPN